MKPAEYSRFALRTALVCAAAMTFAAPVSQAADFKILQPLGDKPMQVFDRTTSVIFVWDVTDAELVHIRELKNLNSHLPVILSSGYNEVEAIQRFTGKGLAGFIQKPYSAAALADKVGTILAEWRATGNGRP